MKPLFLFQLLLLSIFLTNCMNNVEDNSTGNDFDPNDISYSDDIQPIFTSSCGGSGCHINNSRSGVNLTSYNEVISSVGTAYGTIVIPGEPDQSPVVDKIEPNPSNGNRMPLNRSPLATTEINKIRAWIEGGAENN